MSGKESIESVAKRVAGDGSRVPALTPAMSGRQWVKGQSGNPGGQTQTIANMKKLAAQKSLSAMKTMVEVMEDKNQDGRVRVVAAAAILDRAAGKVSDQAPSVPVQKSIDLTQVTPEDLRALLAVLEGRHVVEVPEDDNEPVDDDDGPPTIEGSADAG